ncbi:MAG: hypothetical protein WC700_03300 [Gemmatimonadaceae bacterium]
MSIAALRQQLAEIVEGGRPAMPGLATGMAALDAVLPGHGLPRGRLTEITGAPGSGRTTIARQLVAATLQAGWWVAYVDAARTLAPRDWAALGAHDGLWVVRPGDSSRGAWCADVLLRSGAFGLVVLDGAPVLSRPVAVRLVRLARSSDAAFVLLAPDGQHAGVAGALQLRVQRASAKRRPEPLDLTVRLDGQSRAGARAPARPQPRRLFITIEKGGPAQRVEVECASDEVRHAARRVREDPQVPDRRGVARRDVSRRGVRAGSAGERGIRNGAATALGRTTPRPA